MAKIETHDIQPCEMALIGSWFICAFYRFHLVAFALTATKGLRNYGVWIHPRRAQALGLETGDWVEIENAEDATYKTWTRAFVTEMIRPDTLFMASNAGPRHGARASERKWAPINELIPYRLDPAVGSLKTCEFTIKVDTNRCIGCGYCMIACPYDARYPYEKDYIKEAKGIYGEEIAHKAPYADKCDFCLHHVRQGLNPACVETCPMHARIFGDLDDPNSEVAKLVASGKAKPLHPDLGTKPKVYYIGYQEGGDRS